MTCCSWDGTKAKERDWDKRERPRWWLSEWHHGLYGIPFSPYTVEPNCGDYGETGLDEMGMSQLDWVTTERVCGCCARKEWISCNWRCHRRPWSLTIKIEDGTKQDYYATNAFGVYRVNGGQELQRRQQLRVLPEPRGMQHVGHPRVDVDLAGSMSNGIQPWRSSLEAIISLPHEAFVTIRDPY